MKLSGNSAHTFYVPLLFVFIFLNSCQSKDTSNSSAFDQVKEGKKNGSDSIVEAPKPARTDTIHPASQPDESAVYISKTESRIRKNEQIIKELKGTPNLNVKLFKKVSALEKMNSELKATLYNYNMEEQLRWADCRLKLNIDLDAMSQELIEINKSAK